MYIFKPLIDFFKMIKKNNEYNKMSKSHTKVDSTGNFPDAKIKPAGKKIKSYTNSVSVDDDIKMLFELANKDNQTRYEKETINNGNKYSSSTKFGSDTPSAPSIFDASTGKVHDTDNGSDTNCKHENTINENHIEICVDCGIALHNKLTTEAEWRYYGENDNNHSSDPSRCQYRKAVDKSIKKDLEKLDLTPEIINLSDELYFKVTKGDIKRGDLRWGIIFACVFEAYKMIGNPQTPISIQKIFNKVFAITKRNMSHGINYFRLGMPKEEKKDIQYITAEHFIPSILEKFDIKQEHTENILALYKEIENKSSVINRRNPQSVSCGLVYYYLKKLNADISVGKFGKIVGLSEITISNIMNEIDEVIYNI